MLRILQRNDKDRFRDHLGNGSEFQEICTSVNGEKYKCEF
jgi:hypothetical protein